VVLGGFISLQYGFIGYQIKSEVQLIVEEGQHVLGLEQILLDLLSL
jgi:hypothetical protein